MRTILLIDGNPLMWRSACGRGEQHVCEGIVNYFFDVLSKFDTAEVLLFWDSGKSRWRSDYYPDYKAHRDKQKSEYDLHEIEEQRKQAQKYLSYLGVRNVLVYGVEADDLISWSSNYFEKLTEYDRVIVVTGDRDLWQLISTKVHIYDYLNDRLIDENVCEQLLGVQPLKIVDLKALIGDVSDNLKGVKGIGEKTALKLLFKYEGIEDLLDLKNKKSLAKGKITSNILNQSENLELTYQLVRLPKLEEASSYLTKKEFETLHYELTKVVNADPLAAQVESEFINVYKGKVRAVSNVANELQGMLPYLQPKALIQPSTLSEVDLQIINCKNCPLSSNGKILSIGKSNAEVIILSRNPRNEDSIESELLDKFLNDVELTKDQCWITNVCKCLSPKNRPITYGEMRACKRHLQSEIDLLQPKMIISFGHEAMSLVTPYRSNVSKHVGEILQGSENPLGYIGYVGIMVSPAAALRSVQGEANFNYGTQKIKEFLNSKRG